MLQNVSFGFETIHLISQFYVRRFRNTEISLNLSTEHNIPTFMDICILNSLENESLSQIDSLLHKLSPSAPTIDPHRLAKLLKDADFKLFVARSGEENLIVGMLTLSACKTLSGPKYWIEDVIVDDSCRGMGLGRSLVRAAVSYVKENEERPVIYLTSNPSRVSARNLYRSEGFEEYETGVFRIK